MIVIDASVTLAWLFDETASPDPLNVLLSNEQLIVPTLWRLEVVNAVLKKERQKIITATQANDYVQTLDSLAIEAIDSPASRTLEALLQFARPHQLSSYDAVYLELALDRSARILSLDNNINDAARRLGVQLAS